MKNLKLNHVGWAKRSVPTTLPRGGHVAGAPLPTLHKKTPFSFHA
jgi:hypothetical protein